MDSSHIRTQFPPEPLSIMIHDTHDASKRPFATVSRVSPNESLQRLDSASEGVPNLVPSRPLVVCATRVPSYEWCTRPRGECFSISRSGLRTPQSEVLPDASGVRHYHPQNPTIPSRCTKVINPRFSPNPQLRGDRLQASVSHHESVSYLKRYTACVQAPMLRTRPGC